VAPGLVRAAVYNPDVERYILASVMAYGLWSSVGHAHHSIAGMYDSGRKVSIEGLVTQFQFVNPHPFVVIEVRGAGGTVEQWRLEMDSRGEMSRIGFTTDTLKQGDRINVTGSLARRDANSLYISSLDRPSDGFGYEQVGSSPRLRGR
jgi:hypothetical protein